MNNLIIKEIYRASLFCKMSYYTPSQLDDLFGYKNKISDTLADIKKVLKNNNIFYFEDQFLKCYVFQYNNTIFISFNSLLLYKDKKTKTKFKDNIYIHQGLFEQYKLIESTLQANINLLNSKNMLKKLYIAGYYMGGGLATIAAAILGEKYRNMYLISCYTFGSPKVGNEYFKEYFNANVNCNYRIIIHDKSYSSLSLATHNCYSYHMYKYMLYKHFQDDAFSHVSDALQLETDNILEFKKPVLTKTDKFMMPFYICRNSYDDEIVDIDNYIERFCNIILNYKCNIQKAYDLLEPHASYIVRVQSSNKSSPSNSPSSSNTQTPPKPIQQNDENHIIISDKELLAISDKIDEIQKRLLEYYDKTHQ